MLKELQQLDAIDEEAINQESIASIVAEEAQKHVPQDPSQIRYWMIARKQILHETLFQTLATDQIPTDEEALAARLDEVIQRLTIAEHMHYHADMEKHFTAIQTNMTTTVKNVVQQMQEKTQVACMHLVSQQSLKQMVKETSTFSEHIDYLLTNHKAEYLNKIAKEIQTMERIFQATQAPLSLENQFQKLSQG